MLGLLWVKTFLILVFFFTSLKYETLFKEKLLYNYREPNEYVVDYLQNDMSAWNVGMAQLIMKYYFVSDQSI